MKHRPRTVMSPGLDWCGQTDFESGTALPTSRRPQDIRFSCGPGPAGQLLAPPSFRPPFPPGCTRAASDAAGYTTDNSADDGIEVLNGSTLTLEGSTTIINSGGLELNTDDTVILTDNR